jgi:uncharacterized protein (DUF58 family)
VSAPVDAATAPARARGGWLDNWVFKSRGAESGDVLLLQRRVFIFPTRYGFFFAFSLLAFLATSINYDLSLGFVLTFFLASAGLVAMLHTFRNQLHLVLRPLRADPVFAGQRALFELAVVNRRDDERAAIWLRTPDCEVAIDVPPQADTLAVLSVPAPRRGRLAAPRLTIETRYPLGLVRAWSYWQPALDCVVYPAPAASGTRPPEPPEGSGEGAPRGTGTDDFGGLREYRDTDNPRHIAWRTASLALAAGTPLLAKHFMGTAAAEPLFDLGAFPASVPLEVRLSHLTGQVLEADAQKCAYSLQLGSQRIGPGQGDAHRTACLTALALVDPLPGA